MQTNENGLFHQGTTSDGSQSAQFNQAYNDLNILDTTSWTWLPPNSIRGEPPKPRFDAVSGLLFGKYWVILGGTLHANYLLMMDSMY